jgi:hypothetical protein
MGYQCVGGDVALEVAELRSRTVRVVLRIPASEPRCERSWAAMQSAQLAIEWAMHIVQFGTKFIEGHCQPPRTETSPILPEPVRIRIEPITEEETSRG